MKTILLTLMLLFAGYAVKADNDKPTTEQL
jgi:hypothetical protein